MREGWLRCVDEDGVFYYNEQTHQASVALPMELGGLAEATVLSAKPAQSAATLENAKAQSSKAPVRSAIKKRDSPVVKWQFNDQWMVCQDDSGEYFFDTSTQSSISEPPEALVHLYNEWQILEEQRQELEKVRSERESLEQKLSSQEANTNIPRIDCSYSSAPLPQRSCSREQLLSEGRLKSGSHALSATPRLAASQSSPRLHLVSDVVPMVMPHEAARAVPIPQLHRRHQPLTQRSGSLRPDERSLTPRTVQPSLRRIASAAPCSRPCSARRQDGMPPQRSSALQTPLRHDRVRSQDANCAAKPVLTKRNSTARSPLAAAEWQSPCKLALR